MNGKGQVIVQLVELGISEIVPIEALIAHLKDVFTLNPDVTVSIKNLTNEALQADADTIAIAVKFYTDRSLPVPAELQKILDAQPPAA